MLHSYGIEKAERALEAFETDVAMFDPEMASASKHVLARDELKTLRRRLDAAVLELGREQTETALLDTTYDRYLEAAKAIEESIDPSISGQGRADKENSLALLVAALEAFAPRLVAETAAAAQSDTWMTRLASAASDLEAKLETSGPAVGSPGQQSGLMRSLSQVNAILDSMIREAATQRAGVVSEGPADNLDALPELAGDPNIAAALGRATSKAAGDATDLQMRLAELLRGKAEITNGKQGPKG